MPSLINPFSRVGRRLLALKGGADDVSLQSLYMPNFNAEFAIREVYELYGDVVEIKNKSLGKFGENSLVGTSFATIMGLPVGVLSETYVSDNLITHVSSANNSDTQVLDITGHTVDGNGDFTEVIQFVTLQGQAKVALDTPLARVQRGRNLNGANLAGDVFIYEDDTLTAGVPQTDSKVHLIIHAEDNQSLKLSLTVAKDEYLFVRSSSANISQKTAASGVIRGRIRNKGGVFRTVIRSGIHSQGSDFDGHFEPWLIATPNSDIIVDAEASGPSTSISGTIYGVYATIKS